MRQPRRHRSRATPPEQVTHEEGNLRLAHARPAAPQLCAPFLDLRDLGHRAVDTAIEQLLPPPRPRQRLDQHAVWLRLVGGVISLPSGARIRLRPRYWPSRIGIRTTRVPPSSWLSVAKATPPSPGPAAAAARPRGWPDPRREPSFQLARMTSACSIRKLYSRRLFGREHFDPQAPAGGQPPNTSCAPLLAFLPKAACNARAIIAGIVSCQCSHRSAI